MILAAGGEQRAVGREGERVDALVLVPDDGFAERRGMRGNADSPEPDPPDVVADGENVGGRVEREREDLDPLAGQASEMSHPARP